MAGKISLRKIAETDTNNIIKWRNSDFVRYNLYTKTYLTAERHLEWLEHKVNTGLCVQYIVVAEEENELMDIGTVFIKNIDRQSNKGEFGIFIGEASARGKGYAQVATKKILEIAFSELQLNRVYLTVMEDNISAVKAYEKAGFMVEGVLEEDYLRNDGYVNVLIMGVIKTRWRKL